MNPDTHDTTAKTSGRRALTASAIVLGALLGTALFGGCGAGTPPAAVTSPAPVSTPPGPTAAKFVYVVQNNVANFQAHIFDATASDTVLRFPAGANGNVTPTAIVSAPTGYFITAIAFDQSGTMYLAGINQQPVTASTSVIFVYSGTSTPVRTIQGPAAALNGTIFGMTTDSAGNLYASVTVTPNYGSVYVFAPSADGNTAPTRTIIGDKAQIHLPGAVAVDAMGQVYVADYDSPTPSVFVFAAGASGSATPVRTIGGPATGFVSIDPIAIDTAGNLYAAAEGPSGVYGVINVFSTTANGNATPIRSIGGPALGALSGVGGVQVDATGTLYAVSFAGPNNLQSPFIVSYSASATGNIAPATSATSAAYTSSEFGPLALQ